MRRKDRRRKQWRRRDNVIIEETSGVNIKIFKGKIVN